MTRAVSMLDDFENEEEFTDDGDLEVEVDSNDSEADEEELVEDEVQAEQGEDHDDQDHTDDATDSTTEEDILPEREERIVDAATGRMAAILAEREKVRQYREQYEAAQRELEQYRSQQVQEELPNPYIEPEAYVQSQLAVVQAQVQAQHINHSIARAQAKHGEERVAEVRHWIAQQGQAFTNAAVQHYDPMEYSIAEYEKSQKVQKFLTNEDQVFEEMARQRGYVPLKKESTTSTVATQVAKKPIARRPSLNELDSSSGGSQDEPPISMMDL